MPNVHGIEFNSNQSELVKNLIKELLKDGNCAVYALPNMKPSGELRMAPTPPSPSARCQRGVFLRVRPGVHEAVAIRSMNAKAGAQQISITKYIQEELLQTIRLWRRQTTPRTPSDRVAFSSAVAEVPPALQ